MLSTYIDKSLKYAVYILCFALVGLIIYIAYLFNMPLILPFSFVPSFLLYFLFYNYQYKQILFRVYKIKSTRFLWNNSEFFKLKKSYMRKYLIDKKLLKSPDKIKYLIDYISNLIEESKAPYFRNWGILATIFIPTWTQYIIWVYQHEVKSFKDANTILASVILLLTMLFYVIITFKSLISDWINGYYINLKSLNNLLKDFYLESLDYK